MKRIILIACIAIIATSCQNEVASDSTRGDTTATAATENVTYAYTPLTHSPDNWEMGSQKNVEIVLNALKAFETGNIDACISAFGDSVWMAFDGYDQKISKDTLKAWFTQDRGNLSTFEVKMDDYLPVISKNKKDEWVSLWYKQIVTDKSGKTDSSYHMDDVKLENGKIIVLDQKSRRLPAKK